MKKFIIIAAVLVAWGFALVMLLPSVTYHPPYAPADIIVHLVNPLSMPIWAVTSFAGAFYATRDIKSVLGGAAIAFVILYLLFWAPVFVGVY